MTLILTNGTMTRTRRTGGHVENLRWVNGAPSTATSLASVQANAGATTRAQESGNRKAFFVKFVLPAGFDIRGEDQFGQDDADRFTHTAYPGVTFRVLSVQNYGSFAPVTGLTANVSGTACREDEATTKAPPQPYVEPE